MEGLRKYIDKNNREQHLVKLDEYNSFAKRVGDQLLNFIKKSQNHRDLDLISSANLNFLRGNDNIFSEVETAIQNRKNEIKESSIDKIVVRARNIRRKLSVYFFLE